MRLNEPKKAIVRATVSPAEKLAMAQVAQERGLSLSELIRSVAQPEAA
jgi:hypothetical protein